MFALALGLSLLGLLLGPALLSLGRGRRGLEATLDGLLLGLVPLLVVLRFLPHLHAEMGWSAIGLTAIGYGALWLADRRGHEAGRRLAPSLLLPTFALHALVDGAALSVAFAEHPGGSAEALLRVALVAHRLPEGLLVASVLLPRIGLGPTLLRIGLLGLATVAGALGGRALLGHVVEAPLHALIALGLGAILRLALHRHTPERPRGPRAPAFAALGFLAGVLLVLLVPSPGDVLRRAQPRELSVLESVGPLFVETAPSMLAGLLGAGLLHAFAPRRMDAFLRVPRPLSQAVRGVLFGLPLPVCSCGVLPLLRKLLFGSVPVAAAIAFAVATPELDVGGIALSLRLLGAPFTILRVTASLVAAILVALLVAALARAPDARRQPALPLVSRAPAGTLASRARLAVAEAIGPSLDHLAAFYVIGLLLAGAVEAALDPATLARLGAPLDVFVAAIAAVPTYVCAQGTTPLAAVLVHKGLSVGAALAVLMVGPATNLGVVGLLGRALGTRAAAAFAAGNIALAIGAGLAANALVPRASLPEVHTLVAHDHVGFEWAAAVVLGALLLQSLLRLGPRAWFGAMFGSHDHGHHHDHDHDQDCAGGCEGHDHHHHGPPAVARVLRKVSAPAPPAALARPPRAARGAPRRGGA